MLSVAWVFVLRGLAPPCPALKGVFVAVVFSGKGEQLRCLRGGCQLSGILPCLANLWPCRVLEPQPACSTPASRVPRTTGTMIGIHRESQWTVNLLSLSEQGRGGEADGAVG